MRNLVIGASGFIGNSTYLLLKTKHKDVQGTYYNRKNHDLIKLDITQKWDLEYIFKDIEPDNVYMPAFISGVDYCEQNSQPNEINQLGVRNVVNYCKKSKSNLIFYSTDYIFDGTSGPYLETDKPNPINNYGKTKLLCEEMVKELNKYLIIRTTVVYGYNPNSKNFLMTLTHDLINGIEKKIPYDQIGTPTFVDDLVEISIELVENNKKGIYNIVGPELCSRYVFALKIARIYNLDENLIIPISTLELKQPAKRPLRAGLIIDKIRTELNVNPSGIDRTLKKLRTFFTFIDKKI